MIPILRAQAQAESLQLNYALVAQVLERFLQDELSNKGFKTAVVAMSGGIDSALVGALAVRALGADRVHAVRMPYRSSNPDSLDDAKIVADALGIHLHTIDITPMVDGYLAGYADSQSGAEVSARRKGNIMARARMIALYDFGEALSAMPLGTGNKTERLLGYYTWHDAGDAAPINPLGDLFKTQVWGLSRYLVLPEVVIAKTPSADLEPGQSDEKDLGISYAKADVILHHYLAGYSDSYIVGLGYTPEELALIKRKVNSTHWKRGLPTIAMLSNTSIGEFYLRPIDFKL